jgi:hypothetical protein
LHFLIKHQITEWSFLFCAYVCRKNALNKMMMKQVGERVARRQAASIKIEALVRGGVVRLKMF